LQSQDASQESTHDTSSPVSEVETVVAEKQPAFSGQLIVHFIDVGQGDATFFQLPDNKTMLVDAGRANAGSTVVSYIKHLGYTKIDYLVTTHPDADHIGGVVDVLQSFDVAVLVLFGLVLVVLLGAVVSVLLAGVAVISFNEQAANDKQRIAVVKAVRTISVLFRPGAFNSVFMRPILLIRADQFPSS